MPWPPELDPAAVSAWLGARVGTLAAPAYRARYATQFFADSGAVAGQQPVPGPLLPVKVTVRHLVAPGADVDVVTRRRYPDGTDLVEHMWWSLVDLRIAAVIAAGMPDIPAAGHEIALRPRPAGLGSRELAVDGRSRVLVELADEDLAVCGLELVDVYLAVVAPPALLGRIALTRQP